MSPGKDLDGGATEDATALKGILGMCRPLRVVEE